MARYRESDLRRVARSDVRFGWAVPVYRLTVGFKEPARKRFLRHVFESDRYVITRCNAMLYVELAEADRRYFQEVTDEKELKL